jgi:4-hydroxy-4-methyl-2-oxoglutarate aldolase
MLLKRAGGTIGRTNNVARCGVANGEEWNPGGSVAIAVRNTPRTDMEVVNALGAVGVATIHEVQNRVGLMSTRLRPIYRPAHVAGNALTCEVRPGDNWSIHVAIELAQRGDILVVTPTSPCDDGYFGELLATSLIAHGVRGLIIDAGVRDVAELTTMKFPVWSKTISAHGTDKVLPGNVQTPIICAGASVRPGDVVVADDDGVVVVRREDADQVLASAHEREHREMEKRRQLQEGALSLDIFDMRGPLAVSGLRYVEDSSP